MTLNEIIYSSVFIFASLILIVVVVSFFLQLSHPADRKKFGNNAEYSDHQNNEIHNASLNNSNFANKIYYPANSKIDQIEMYLLEENYRREESKHFINERRRENEKPGARYKVLNPHYIRTYNRASNF
jgi:hypothetical protein